MPQGHEFVLNTNHYTKLAYTLVSPKDGDLAAGETDAAIVWRPLAGRWSRIPVRT